MQIGSENRKKVMWASALGGIAVLLIAYQLFSSPSGPVTAAQPTTTTSGAKPRTRLGRGGREHVIEERLDPTLDLRSLAETEQTKYTGSGRNIFVAQVDIPKPVASGLAEITN
ncbi:MAG: hypothetical protein DMG81_13100, partial [Acidobacteria bacterium]